MRTSREPLNAHSHKSTDPVHVNGWKQNAGKASFGALATSKLSAVSKTEEYGWFACRVLHGRSAIKCRGKGELSVCVESILAARLQPSLE